MKPGDRVRQGLEWCAGAVRRAGSSLPLFRCVVPHPLVEVLLGGHAKERVNPNLARTRGSAWSQSPLPSSRCDGRGLSRGPRGVPGASRVAIRWLGLGACATLVFGGLTACGGVTASDPRTRGAVDGGQREDVTRGDGEDAGAYGGSNAVSPGSAAGGAGPAGDGDSSSSGDPSSGGASSGGANAMGGGSSSPGGSGGGAEGLGGASAMGGASSGGASAMGGALATGGDASDVGAGGSEASGGAGGTDSEFPRPEFLPEQCELRSAPEASDTACALSARCDGSFATTTCEQSEAGAWQCDCGFNAVGVLLEIDGAAGVEACAVAMGPCTAAELDTDAESCIDATQPTSPDVCSLTRSCTREIRSPLPQGVEARWLREFGAGCSPFGNAFECYTDGVDSAFPSYKVISNDVYAACGPYLDYVLSGEAPVFGTTVECAGTEFEPSASGCSALRRCGPVMELADGVQLGALEVNYGACNEEADGSTGCYCQYGQAQLLFTEEGAPSDELCAEIVATCVEGTEVQALSELQCAETSLLAFDTSCDVYATCEQEVIVNDRPARAEATLAGSCQWAADAGAWLCNCENLAQGFELTPPDLTAFDACSLLPEACAESLPVFAGPAEPQSDL